jgi:hypothetical protein
VPRSNLTVTATTMRIPKIKQNMFGLLTILLLIPLFSYAQKSIPIPAPDDVSLRFSTEDGRNEYHLGEPIKVKFSFSGSARSRDLYVDLSPDCAWGVDGCRMEVKCEPAGEPVVTADYFGTYDKFQRVLVGACQGKGIPLEARWGGICGCDVVGFLRNSPVYGPFPLSSYVRLRVPGNYTCYATSTQVVTSIHGERFSTRSSPLELTLIDDPSWAHTAALEYADRYEKLCNTKEKPESLQECVDIATRITSLDTLDSLAIEVKHVKGQAFYWNGFWNAIWSSSHPREALRFMTKRMQDPDFRVDRDFLQELVIRSLQLDSPGIFQSSEPAIYQSQALEKLREHVRLLGSSLPNKNADTIDKSLQAYRSLAELRQCDGHPLIPDEERELVLAATRRP